MKKILIWGTGKLAKQFVENGFHAKLIGFIETNKKNDIFMKIPVYDSQEIPEDYDYIIVANSYGAEIYALCIRIGIDISKLIFMYGLNNNVGCEEQLVLRDILSEKNYINYCLKLKKRTPLQDNSFIYNDIEKYKKLNKRKNFEIQENYIWPIIADKYAAAGRMGNYFFQDLWAAKLIFKSGIKKHFDIGSRVDGFIAHLLAMNIEVSIIDIREFPGKVENLYTIVDDATNLKQLKDESINSMSALCSVEHFGLGRYGDVIDPEACFKCFMQMQKKVQKKGNLYLSVPIGKERVEFNAHRVFYASTIIDSFTDMELQEFSCCAEGKIEYNVDIQKYDTDSHNGEYRYGLFHFIKK